MTDKPDGIETLGSYPPELKVSPRRQWWLAAGSLRFAIVALCIWAFLFGLRVFQAFYDKGVDPLGWIALTCYFVGVILLIPSVVHFARLRNRINRMGKAAGRSSRR
jgi:hypothetical protein